MYVSLMIVSSHMCDVRLSKYFWDAVIKRMINVKTSQMCLSDEDEFVSDIMIDIKGIRGRLFPIPLLLYDKTLMGHIVISRVYKKKEDSKRVVKFGGRFALLPDKINIFSSQFQLVLRENRSYPLDYIYGIKLYHSVCPNTSVMIEQKLVNIIENDLKIPIPPEVSIQVIPEDRSVFSVSIVLRGTRMICIPTHTSSFNKFKNLVQSIAEISSQLNKYLTSLFKVKDGLFIVEVSRSCQWNKMISIINTIQKDKIYLIWREMRSISIDAWKTFTDFKNKSDSFDMLPESCLPDIRIVNEIVTKLETYEKEITDIYDTLQVNISKLDVFIKSSDIQAIEKRKGEVLKGLHEQMNLLKARVSEATSFDADSVMKVSLFFSIYSSEFYEKAVVLFFHS